MDSDGIDVETMDVDHPHLAVGGDGAIEGDERDSTASPHHLSGYHESRDMEAQSVCGSEAGWWDGSIDGEQDDWGITDGDSGEGQLSFGDRFPGTLHIVLLLDIALALHFLAETNVQVRLDSEGEYAIYEDGGEPKR